MRARTFAALMVALLFAWPVAAQEQRGVHRRRRQGRVRAQCCPASPSRRRAEHRRRPEHRHRHGRAPIASRRSPRAPTRSPRRCRASAREEAGRRPRRSRPGQEGRLRAGARRRHRIGAGHGRVAARRRQAERAADQHPRASRSSCCPKGRDFTTLVTQAPGANNEAKLGGLSIDGASAGENRYIIDGIETTNLQTRHVGQERDRRLRRRGPGQVERLHRGVRRRHRRRHQRDHQERHQQLARQRAVQLAGGPALRRPCRPRHDACETGIRRSASTRQLGPRRVHHVSRRTSRPASSPASRSAVRSRRTGRGSSARTSRR